MKNAEKPTWSISEVEKLVGLSRRQIQRCFYAGKGGLGLSASDPGSWGKRSYGVHDLALLFLVAQRVHRGSTLSTAAREVSERLENHSILDLLSDELERLDDKLESILNQLVCARALTTALENNDNKHALLGEIQERAKRVEDAVFDEPNQTEESALPSEELLEQLIEHFSQNTRKPIP